MTPKEPPAFGPGPNGYDRYVLLSKVHLCPEWPPTLGIDDSWCDEIEPGVRENGQLEPIGITPCPHGWAVVFKYHLYTVLTRIHKEAPSFVVWGRVRAYFSKEEHLLDQWIENHHRKIDPDLLRDKFLLPLLQSGNNQVKAAKKLGISKSYVTMLLHPEEYADRPHAGVHPVNFAQNGTSVAPSPSDGQPVPSVPLTPPPNSGGSPPPPISLIPETPPETGSSSTSPALSGSTGGTTGARASASRAASAGGSSVAPAPPSFLSPPSPPSPLRRLREALEGLQGTMKMPEWEDALDDESVARAARDLLASLDASLYDFRAYLDDGRRSKDGPLPRAQVFTLKIRDEVRIKTEENGHRAFVMAHLPSGRAKLRVIRDGKKSEEIHLERDLIPVIHVGAKA